MKNFEYSLVSHTIWGSFDSGLVVAKDRVEAVELARDEIRKAVDDINNACDKLGISQSVDVDLSHIELREVFDFQTAFDEWAMNFNDEVNGLLFEFNKADKIITLRYPPSTLAHKMIEVTHPKIGEVYYEIKIDDFNLDIAMYIKDNFEEDWVVSFGKQPTNMSMFGNFLKFFVGQLCTVESKFAQVDECILDEDNMEYTVHGFLIPKQTISFDTYSDWNSIKGLMGQPIFDCQIDKDYLDDSIIYQFQIVDLNYDYVKGEFDLNDTVKPFGGRTIHRDYQEVIVTFKKDKELTVENCSLDKVIEIRGFKIGDTMYEVHIDASGAREIFDVFAERGEVTSEIRDALEKAVDKIEC